MDPNLLIVSRTQVEWPVLRKTVLQATGFQPSSVIAQCPVSFSKNAEFLLFAAYLILDITEEDAHKLMLHLPREAMDFLHYTFLIACDRDIIEDLREKTRAHYTITDCGRGYCVLGTGPLSIWYDAIMLNLRVSWKGMKNTRLLLNKMLLLLEREGLQALFPPKTSLPDGTFLLEKQ